MHETFSVIRDLVMYSEGQLKYGMCRSEYLRTNDNKDQYCPAARSIALPLDHCYAAPSLPDAVKRCWARKHIGGNQIMRRTLAVSLFALAALLTTVSAQASNKSGVSTPVAVSSISGTSAGTLVVTLCETAACVPVGV